MENENPTAIWHPHVPPNWKLRARLWIGVLFLLLAGSDYMLLCFSYDRDNPLPQISGVVILGALGSKLLLICMWRRLSWARYALATLLSLSIAALALGMILIIGDYMAHSEGSLKKLLVGIALQALALVPLARSRSIRKQMHPMTGRD